MNGRMSYGGLVEFCNAMQSSFGRSLTYPTSDVSQLISKDHVIAAPEGCTKAGKAKREPYDYAERDKISESLCLEEAWESVPLYSLEDVVLGVIEDFWIISALFFDCVDDPVEDGFWKDDFSLGSGENEGVQYFLRTGAYVGTGYCVSR